MLFFSIHYHVADLIHSLINSPAGTSLAHSAILLPLLQFIFLQFLSYTLLISWTWFAAISIRELLSCSRAIILVVWAITWFTIFALNSWFFPDSYFALSWIGKTTAIISVVLFILTGVMAYINLFYYRRHIVLGSLFLLLVCIISGLIVYDAKAPSFIIENNKKPNIIFIGLDSLRPDFTGYLGNQNIKTPQIDAFLTSATTFTDAYTPLARTFPAWISILTAKYPKLSGARNNLVDPARITPNDTIAKRLKAAGYETMYGTDEERFSNITQDYGFDHIIGPHMGLDDFILGGLNDFPLTNLLINTPMGKFLFPFNYANRAANITYEPTTFLQLVKLSLRHRNHQKPLFLAVHLCVTHWPYTWARDLQASDAPQPVRYKSSVEEVDRQLGALLMILKNNGLLQHSLVVLLSDHGTTVGLPGDRITTPQKFQEPPERLPEQRWKWLPMYKLSTTSADIIGNYSLDTSYGQGTDLLSLKQYHVLLAFKGFGVNMPARLVTTRVSLLDIAPTILNFLGLPPLNHVDGISVFAPETSRPLFFETGYKIAAIESSHISSNQVVEQGIGLYQIKPQSGLLFVDPAMEKNIIDMKQRAVMQGDWLLARYPSDNRTHLTLNAAHLTMNSYQLPPFFILANIKTGEWGIDFSTPFAKSAPLAELFKQFYGFYGDEVPHDKLSQSYLLG